jgi:hypothetical protein
MNLWFSVQRSAFRVMKKISMFGIVARDTEIRISQSEIQQPEATKAAKNPYDENPNDQNDSTTVLAQLCFDFWDFGIVSNFVLRISDLRILI